MKNRIAALSVATLLGSGLLAITAPAAEAAGCVTPREYARVKNGASMATVAKVFGTPGKREVRSSGYGTTVEIRSYRACTQFGVVSISFTNNRLTAKASVF